MTVNIAIVGAGRIAHSHARAICRAQDALLVAVVDSDRSAAVKFADEYDVALHATDLDRALQSSDVDVVIVCSPTSLHREHALAALSAGKHALVEKPFATDTAEATEMIAIADQSGLKLMSGQVVRFMPMFSFARQFIESGKLGAPVQSVERRLTYRRDNFPWWADLPQFLVSHWGSHSLDILCHLVDDEVEQMLCSAASVASKFGVVDDFTLQARFRSGFRSAIAMSFTSRFPVHDLAIIGTEATLQFECYRSVSVNGEIAVELTETQMIDEGFDAQLRALIDAICGERELQSSGRSVLRSLEAIAAAETSARTGQVVQLPSR